MRGVINLKSGGKIVIGNSEKIPALTSDEIDKQQSYPIVKRNDLVQKARHQMSAKELKLVDYMVSKVQRTDQGFTDVVTSIAEINEVMGFGRGSKSAKETAKALLNLSNKGFWFQLDEHTISVARWLQTAKIADDGSAILKLDDQLAPYLLRLTRKDSKAIYSLSTIVNLKSKYAVMLYELLMSWGGSMGVNGTPDEFLEYFGKPQMTWWQFNGRYLQPAIREINEKANIRVHYASRRRGKSVVEVELDFEGQISDGMWNSKSHVELKKEAAAKRKAKAIQPSADPDALSDEEIAKLQKQLADELARRDQKLKSRKQRLTEQGISETFPLEHEDQKEAESAATGVSGHQPEPLDATSITGGDEVRLIKAGDLSDLRHNMLRVEISDTLQAVTVYTNGNTRLKVMAGKHAGKTVFANATLLTLA
jgi:plasmid replication initiation protein